MKLKKKKQLYCIWAVDVKLLEDYMKIKCLQVLET